MKYLYRIFSVFAGIGLLYGCLEDPELSDDIINGGVPVITGDSIGVIKANYMEAYAVVSKHNGALATQYGFYVSRENESEKDTVVAEAAPVVDGAIDFKVMITGLEPNTKYVVRAFAVNRMGEGLGAELKKTTTTGLGSIITLEPDSVKGTSAIAGGSIVEPGEGEIVERGIFLAGQPDMSLKDTILSPLKVDSFTVKMTELDTMSTYYVQAFVRNSFGFFTGEVNSFTTKNGKPEIESFSILEWGFDEASYTAMLASEGDAPVTSKGVCWSETPYPTTDDQTAINTTGDFTGTIKNLKPFTKYYIRAFATNAAFGTTYSNMVEITTRNDQPVVETTEVFSIVDGFAGIQGNVLSAGMGEITVAGFCWSTFPNPSIVNHRKDITNTEGPFRGYIGELTGGTTYYVRAFAQNTGGQTAYGNELTVETPPIFTSMASFTGDMRLPNSSALFVIDNSAYLLGGDKGIEYTNELWAYNASDRWDRVSSLPDTARKWQTAVTINNIGYAFGGLNDEGKYTDKMYCYLPNQNRWDNIQPITGPVPAPMHSSVSSSVSTSAYFIGGYRDSVLNEVWRFDTYSRIWEQKPDFPVKQYRGIAVTINNEMVYAGLGVSTPDGTVPNRTLWSSFGNFNVWSEETSLPVEAGSVRGGVAYKGSIYIVNNAGNIWKYDVAAKVWTEKSRLPASNRGDYQHCMFVLNDMIYIGLGTSQKSLLKYDPVWDN
ncbi:MAG: hypothetical protein LBQ73_00215 [Tannerellaceae bacterium]|jgi:hypothetical protein|nr:hypothetical protein [Tannerellaceae bacterium]